MKILANLSPCHTLHTYECGRLSAITMCLMGKIWACIGWPIAMAMSAVVFHRGRTSAIASVAFTRAWKATRQQCRRRRTITVMKILANLSPSHTLHTWEHNMVSIRDWTRTLSLISNGKLSLPHNLTSDGLRVFQLNYHFPQIFFFHVTTN